MKEVCMHHTLYIAALFEGASRSGMKSGMMRQRVHPGERPYSSGGTEGFCKP